jgi:hypothetical protein
MKVLGSLIAAIGVITSLLSLRMTTTVTTSVPSALGYGITDSSEVHNLGLLQNQAFVFSAGLAVFICGTVLFATGLILEQIAAPVRPSTASVEPAAEVVVSANTSGTRPLSPVEYETISDEQKAKNARADRAVYIAAAAVAICIFVLWLATKG